MELRQMRYFKAVADAQSFLGAATQLYVAQPALSRSIAKLEEDMGCRLFIRHSGGVSLTEHGVRFYAYATELLDRVREVTDAMAEESGVLRGAASMGAPQVLHSKLVVAVAIEFLSTYPSCELNLVQGAIASLREKIDDGSIDLAIVSDPVGERLHFTKLVRENVCIICRNEDREKFPAVFHPEDLGQFPLILTGYPGFLRLLLEKRFPRQRHALHIRSEVNSSALLIDLVIGNVGFGVAPCSAIPLGSDLAYVPIEGLDVSWGIATTWQRRKMPIIKVVEDLLVARVQSLITSGQWPTATLL